MNNNINKYSNIATKGRTTRDLMILVLEKAANHLKAAKQHMLNKESIELGKHIFIAVEILNGLSRTVTVREDIPHSAETLSMYQNLQFQIEQLIVKKSPAEDYDYFINYFLKLKLAWEELQGSAVELLSHNSENINISSYNTSSPQSGDKYISGFDKEGKFEVIT